MKIIRTRNHEVIKIIIAVILLTAGIGIGFAIGAWGIKLQSTTGYENTKLNTQYEKMTTAVPTDTYSIKTQDKIESSNAGFSNELKTLEIANGIFVDSAPIMGDTRGAKVIIVEFSDYQCPFCKTFFDESFRRIRDAYINTGKVIYAFRDYPLTNHPQALPAAEVANCSADQGKFWEMHDMLFERQDQWSYKENAKELMLEFADGMDLDMEKFNECLDTQKYLFKIQKHIADGLRYGTTGTPTFYINNKKIMGAQTFETFSRIIDQEYARPIPQDPTQETRQIEVVTSSDI